MSYFINETDTVFAQEVKALVPKITLILTQAGYKVGRNEQTLRLVGKEPFKNLYSTKEENPDGRKLVYIASGLSKKAGARLAASGLRTVVPEAHEKTIANLLLANDIEVSTVAEGDTYSWRKNRPIMATPKSWKAALPRLLQQERAWTRAGQAKETLQTGIKALAQAESDEERQTLAAQVVKNYNLTRDRAMALIQSKDREVRTDMVRALPVLKNYFDQQTTVPWRQQLSDIAAAKTQELNQTLWVYGGDREPFEI